jgi:hypothetical protein
MTDNQKVAAAWDALRSVLDGDEKSLTDAIKEARGNQQDT